MPDELACEVSARYAVNGPFAQLQRTVPVEGGEVSLLLMRVVTSLGNQFIDGRRGCLRLSTRRLSILRSNRLSRDRVLVIPPHAIVDVSGQGPNDSVRLAYRDHRGEREVTIVMWRRPATLDRAGLESGELDESLRRVANALAPWLEG